VRTVEGSQHEKVPGYTGPKQFLLCTGPCMCGEVDTCLVYTGMQANNKYADITVYFHRFNSCRFNYCMYIYFKYMHFLYNSTCIEHIDQLDGRHKQSARRVSYLVEDANLIYVTCRVGQ
jgi:hypothetical protein